MSANRDELVHLIEGLPADQVEAMFVNARRRAAKKPKGTWPPKFVGMIQDGPTNGSTTGFGHVS